MKQFEMHNLAVRYIIEDRRDSNRCMWCGIPSENPYCSTYCNDDLSPPKIKPEELQEVLTEIDTYGARKKFSTH